LAFSVPSVFSVASVVNPAFVFFLSSCLSANHVCREPPPCRGEPRILCLGTSTLDFQRL